MAGIGKVTQAFIHGALATSIVACGGSKEEPQAPQQQYQQGPYQQQPQGGYQQQPQGGYQQQPQQGGYPQQQPQPAPTGQPAPQGPIPSAQPGSPATPLDPAAGAAATMILNQLATSEAPAGAKPVGSPLVGNFQQGQSLEGSVQLQPGKCYTVVAAGPPPVTEVNVQLVAQTPIPNMAPILAQDQDQGATSVLGRKPNCYKWPLPVGAAVKVLVTVAGGSGIAAAQVYEK